MTIKRTMATLSTPGRFDFFDDVEASVFLASAMPVMTAAFDPVYGEGWSRMQTLSMLTMPLCHNQLATGSNGMAAAFTLSRAVADEEELLLIAVHPDFRRQGLGSILLSRLKTLSKQRGCKQMFLEARNNNPARHLYESLNFIPMGKRKNYYTGNGGQSYDAVTYACDLE